MPHPTPPPPRLLLVEGQNDKHVIGHLWQRIYGSDLSFCISDKQSVEQLLRSIGTEAMTPGREALGIVVDTNDDVSSRWEAVVDRLRGAGIDPPTRLDPAGAIIDGTPRVGIWLMPDNASTGELEDFVAKMVPSDDTVWPMSKGYIEGIPRPERKFKEGKILRAQIHAWLAAREDPRLMGLAIGTKDLDIDGALCKRFAGWLERLFG